MTPAFPNFVGNIAFIHVKGTSDRVPGKGKRLLGGLPLFLHTIHTCQAVPLIDAIVIDSDDPVSYPHLTLPTKRRV